MGMPIRMLLFLALMAGANSAASAAAPDKTWPDRTVRIITGGAGASPDVVARTLADVFAKRWKQAVIVENRPGADGILAVKGLPDRREGLRATED
jgi:tripartite-type tricarboxylate transporter receptor subunit TctC